MYTRGDARLRRRWRRSITARESGEGQIVDVSLLAGNMYGASLDLQAYLAIGGERLLAPVSRLDMGNPMSGTLYPTADGRWVTLTMPDTDRWWPGFAPLVGIDPEDPRFDSHEKRCERNRLELMQVLEQRVPAARRRRTGGDVFDRSAALGRRDRGLRLPASDPSVYRNRYLLELEHPSLGRVKTLGFPIFMSDGAARLDRLAPCAGNTRREDPARLARLRPRTGSPSSQRTASWR